MISYVLALSANVCFAAAAVAFANFSKKTSVYWMNAFKATVSFLFCALSVLFLKEIFWYKEQIYFLLSGFIGLMVGDIFLLKAFTLLGAGRSLVLFGFHPLFLGVAAYFAFGQIIYWQQGLAVVFLIACLLVFSLENKKKNKSWGTKGLIFALIGVTLDATGILFTKYAFETGESHFFQANMIRSLGAMTGFMIFSLFKPIRFIPSFSAFTTKQKIIVFLASFCGTYLSLSLYMAAIKYGHLATISAIAVTSPFMASLIESVIEKKWPSPYFIVAFIFFLLGFSLLLFHHFIDF